MSSATTSTNLSAEFVSTATKSSTPFSSTTAASLLDTTEGAATSIVEDLKLNASPTVSEAIPEVAPTATNEAEASSENTPPGFEAQKKSSPWLDNVIQIDKDAAQHVGRGSLVRGLKSTQMILSSPECSLEAAREKLNETLDTMKSLQYDVHVMFPESMESVMKHDVSIISPNDGLLLTVHLLSEKKELNTKLMVVVGEFRDIGVTANTLREIRKARNESTDIGELCGAWTAGCKDYSLWVTDAETATLYLNTKKSFDPFTHIVFPELMHISPAICFLLQMIKIYLEKSKAPVVVRGEADHKHKRKGETESSTGTKSNARKEQEAFHTVKVILGVSLKNSERIESVFTGGDENCSITVSNSSKNTMVDQSPSFRTTFSLDECCALTQSGVLHLVGASSARIPEKKATQYCSSVAAELIKLLTKDASSPRRIHLYTGDCNAVLGSLREAPACKEVHVLGIRDLTYRSPFSFSVEGAESRSVVYVLENTECPSACGFLPPHFVLDFGTVGQVVQAGRAEGLVGGCVCTWSTTEDLTEHSATVLCSGAYFQLYPALSDSRITSCLSYTMTDLERTWLISARVNATTLCVSSPLLALPDPLVSTVSGYLTNVCLTEESPELSLTGEMAARLPININLATFVVNSCALHLGELAIAVASVAVFSVRNPPCHFNHSAEEMLLWSTKIKESRQNLAPNLVKESDLLADVAAYLEWHRLMLDADPRASSSFPTEIGVSLFQLECIHRLITVMCCQLSDYLNLQDMNNSTFIVALQRRLVESSDSVLISFLYAASLARQAAFVRHSETDSFWDGGDASFVFARSTRKMIPSLSVPSHVELTSETTLICADIDVSSTGRVFEGARFTVLNTEFFNAILLLLSPSIVYSAPQLEGGEGKQMFSVSFGVSYNGHRKRYRLAVSEAEAVLHFRQKWNLALSFLQMYRQLRRPVSQNSFFDALRARIRCFHLENFLVSLRKELYELVLSIDAAEHYGNVDFTHSHFLRCDNVLFPLEVEPADKVILLSFSDIASKSFPLRGDERGETAISVSDANSSDPRSGELSTSFVDEDGEVENIEEFYFLHHSPIIDA